MITDLYKQIIRNHWLEPSENGSGTYDPMLRPQLGVVLQREDGNYVAHPTNLNEEVVKAVLRLDVPVAFTMSSDTTAALVEQVEPEQTHVGDPRSGIMLPIIDSVESLASGRSTVPRDCFISLCRKEQFVLVWADTVGRNLRFTPCVTCIDRNLCFRLKKSSPKRATSKLGS